MLTRPFLIATAALGCAALSQLQPANASPQGLAPAASATSRARKAEPEPRSVERMIAAAEEFRSAVRSLAAQPPEKAHDHAIEAANNALSDTQYAIVIERLLNASANLEGSIRNIRSAKPGTSRDMAIDEANDALLEARRALEDMPRSATPPLALIEPKDWGK